MNDGFLYRSLPAFTGLLVFMPACPADEPSATDTDATDGSDSSATTNPSTTNTSTTQSQDTGSSESSPTEPTEGSSDTGPVTCPEGSMCADALPDGWFGPLIMSRNPSGAEMPECPGEFPIAGPTLLDGFNGAGPAECTCECSPPAMLSCYASVSISQNDNCYGYYYYGGYNQVSEICSNIDIDGFARFQLFGGYNPGMCTNEQSEEIPPIDWEAEIKTCQLTDMPLSCEGDGLCIPPPATGFESVWCLYQQGDAGCPAGVFNTKHKFYTGAEDTRECSDCTCGSNPATCNSADLLIFEGPDCAGEPATTLPSNSGCEDVIAGSVAVQYPGAGTCPVASQPHAMGEASPTGVFTFCCTG